MKLLLLLALVGLAASRSAPITRETPQQFLYEYDSQIATGIEEVSNQFSAMRTRFQVLMQTDGVVDSDTGAQRWTVAFKEVNVRQRNNATEQLPKKMLPMENFKNLENSQLWRQIQQLLKKPFECLIKPQLSIVKVSFQKDDPFWSVNIKKGFLQMLQLNFLPKGETADTVEKGQWTKEEDEMTVADVCKTFYSVEKVRFHEAASKIFKVEKAIDFSRCKNPIDGTRNFPGMWNGLQHSDRIQTETNKQVLNINNFGKFFVLKAAESDRFLVKKASMRTIYTLAPYTESMHGSEKVIAIQKLKLLRQAEEAAIATSELVEQPEGLRLIFPEEAKIVDTAALISEVAELLKKLGQIRTDKSDESLDMKLYEQILRIVRFHVKTPEELQTILEQLKELVGEGEQLKRIVRIFIFDICPQANTNACVQFLMKVVRMIVKADATPECIRVAQIGVEHIPIVFSKLSMMGKIQLKTLKSVMQVLKTDEFRRQLLNEKMMPIFSSAWLSLGGMVNVYFSRQGGVEPFVLPMTESDEVARQNWNSPWLLRQKMAVESEEFRQEFIEEVREALKSTSNIRKALAIRVIKNCGLFEFYEDLKTVIFQRDSTRVSERVQAVYATQNMLRRQTLSRLTNIEVSSILEEQKFIRNNQEYIRHFDEMSRNIQADLLRCFRNVREDPELRIACYRVLIQCPVKQYTLNILVQSIVSDPSQLVFSYCVQHMTQIVKSPLPRYQRAIPTIRSALSMLKRRQPFSSTFSRIFSGQMWNQLHDMGFSIETDMILSDKSFTPRWTHFRLEHQSLGRNTPLIEIGVRTEGLQSLMEKTFGPRGLINSLKDIYTVVQRLSRGRRSLQDTIKPEQLLEILPRVLEEVPRMEICVSLMGYDVIYVRNTRQVRQLIQNTSIAQLNNYLSNIRRNLKLLTSLFTISNTYELPTPVGTILDFNCIGSISVLLKQPSIEMKSGESQMEMIAQVQPIITLQAFKRIGSNMHLLNHYHQWETTLHMGLPQVTQMRLRIDVSDEMKPKVALTCTIPQRKTQVLTFNNQAFSTIAEFFFTEEGKLQTQYIKQTIQHRSIVKPTIIRMQKPLINKILAFFGVQVEITGQYFSNEQLYRGPCALLNGRSQMSIQVSPISEQTTGPIIWTAQLMGELEGEKKQIQKLECKLRLMKSSTEGETLVQKLAQVQFKPEYVESQMQKFEMKLRWFVNLPSTYTAEGFLMTINGQIQLPEDLKMPVQTPEGHWMKTVEWVKERQMQLTMQIRSGEEEEVATIKITQSTNKALKQLLQKMSQKQLIQTFPLLKKCQKEAQLTEESASNRIFTPSCIEQLKQFNKLSQMKLEIVRKVDWFLNRRNSQVLDFCMQKMGLYLQPFLVGSVVAKDADRNRIVIVSQPSPLDMRVHNLNVSCGWQMWWRSIQLPATPFYWAGVDPVVATFIDHVKGGAVKCSLRQSHVKTFDNVVYSIPQPTYQQIAEHKCPVLVAADCSERKQFQLLTHIQDGKKFITLLLNKGEPGKWLKIEVIKPVNGEQKDATIKFNGNELTQTSEQQVMLDREISIEGKDAQFVISKYQYADTSMYKILCQQHHLQLLVGGPQLRSVELRVSPFYHSKMCGLCGDYNSEKMREFKGPNMQVQTTAQKMVQQYVLPVSEQCQQVIKADPISIQDYSQVHESQVSMPSFHLYSRIGEPKQRQSCQVAVNSKYVKTFNHRELPFMTKPLQQLFDRTECPLKLAVGQIDDLNVHINLKPSIEKIQIQVNGEEQLLPISHAAIELIDEQEFAGLKLKVEKIIKHLSPVYRCTLAKGDKKIVIDILSNKRINIKGDAFLAEYGICQLTHVSQLTHTTAESQQKMLKYIAGSQCQHRFQSHLQRCEVKSQKMVPFHQSGDLELHQVKYLTQELMQKMADEPKSVLVLAASSLKDETPVTTQMSFSRQGDEIVRHLRVKKDDDTVAEVIMQQGQQPKVKVNGQAKSLGQLAEQTPISSGFKCQYMGDSNELVISSGSSFLIVTVKMEEEPIVSIQRQQRHPEYQNLGICEATATEWSEFAHTNPHAVLLRALEQTVEADRSVVTEQEQEATQRVIDSIERVEFLPEYPEY